MDDSPAVLPAMTLSELATFKKRCQPVTLPDYILRNRHNKTARGMTKTAYRGGHLGRLSDEAQTLTVKGTLARTRSLNYMVQRVPFAPRASVNAAAN